MKKIDCWDGQLENSKIEYDSGHPKKAYEIKSDVHIVTDFSETDFDKADKTDYVVAASCGVLTGLLDSFWGGEFSLSAAQEWGRCKANNFVIKVAQMRGYGKRELDGAIRFLEKEAPIPSDQLTPIWGGALQHHFRDFAHHASIVGLVFSIISQFTGLSYGTNTEGLFEMHELPDKSLIGKSFEEKLFNGTAIWALHLVSDMAGSSNSAGKGTGIPGPILSLAKELSILPLIRDLKIVYKGEEIHLSIMLSKIFNGTAFEYSSNKDRIRFDLRTEMGVYAYGVKQSIPVAINQCMVRAFYFVKRFYMEISNKQIKGIKDISKLEPDHFLPWNNKCIVRMLTISSGVFCTVDASDAVIRAFIESSQTKTEFLTQFLLRTNFVGIGNFIVSIKNDITANTVGHKQTGRAEIQTIEKGGAGLSTESITIDIVVDGDIVDVSNMGIYDYAFYRMYNYVKKKKENFLEAQNMYIGMAREIIQLEDDETDLFYKVASHSRHQLMVENEDLVMRLFTLYGVEYTPIAGDAKDKFYMPFYRIEDDKKIGYMFSYSMTAYIKWEDIKKTYKIDGIKVVVLIELGNDSKMRDIIIGNEIRLSGGFVQYMSLKELFSLISEDEYDVYMKYARKFNDNIKRLIGYRTIVVPSDSSVEELKKDIICELKTINFDKQLSQAGLYENQIKIIKKNFWDRELYQAIIGEASFAESFISSEWYYKNHVEFSILEQTAVIAGYLKSVEQLLYSIVKLSEGSGKQIKKYGGGRSDYIEYCVANESLIDSTLGSIIGYIRHYPDLWDVNTYVKNYVADKLNIYRDKYRNDHFHKDNVNSIEEIEEIRANTILIHYLLLGAMKISDSDKEWIGIVIKQKEEKNERDISYLMLEKWLNRIIGGDVLLPKSSKLYFKIGTCGTEQWNIEFSTVSGFDDRGFPQNIKLPYIGDDLKWDKVLEKDEMEKRVVSLIKEYLEKGLYSGNLKTYSMIFAGWFGHPQVLFQR